MKKRIAVAALVATVVAGAGTALAASGSGSTSSDYNPVASTRLTDTRTAGGAVGVDKTLVVSAGSSVPANATAITVNITVTAPTATSGYVVAYADGTTRPAQGSTINFTKGETIATQATVPVSDGKIDLYNASGGTVQLVVDLEGYFTPTAAPYTPPTATTWTPTISSGDTINTGGSAVSRATLVGTYTLEPGTYQLTVDAKATPIVQSSASTQVFPQLFVYDQPLSSSFAGNVLNVGSGALESGTFDNIDSYYSGTGSITITGTAPVTIYTYAFGYDSDTSAGTYTLDNLTETAVPQAG